MECEVELYRYLKVEWFVLSVALSFSISRVALADIFAYGIAQLLHVIMCMCTHTCTWHNIIAKVVKDAHKLHSKI